jgi:hypothetical protein
LLRKKPGGAAEIVEEVRIVRLLLQCGLQILNRVGELPRLLLGNPKRTLFVSEFQMRKRARTIPSAKIFLVASGRPV